MDRSVIRKAKANYYDEKFNKYSRNIKQPCFKLNTILSLTVLFLPRSLGPFYHFICCGVTIKIGQNFLDT